MGHDSIIISYRNKILMEWFQDDRIKNNDMDFCIYIPIYTVMIALQLAQLMEITSFCDSSSGPHFNIKNIFPRYGDSHVKDKMVGETVLSLAWASLYW